MTPRWRTLAGPPGPQPHVSQHTTTWYGSSRLAPVMTSSPGRCREGLDSVYTPLPLKLLKTVSSSVQKVLSYS